MHGFIYFMFNFKSVLKSDRMSQKRQFVIKNDDDETINFGLFNNIIYYDFLVKIII